MSKYPKVISIETPDGGGEAIKRKRGVNWVVSTPTRDFQFYGTAPQVKAEIRRLLNEDYPDGDFSIGKRPTDDS